MQSVKTRQGSDYGSDNELLMAKFRLKFLVRKTTRTFRHDLNQIIYDHTVEVTNILQYKIKIELKNRVAIKYSHSVINSSRDIALLTKVCLVKAMVFPVVTYGCES